MMHEGLALSQTVILRDDQGVVHTFVPGTVPPDWARERITNPKAWGYQVLDKPGPRVDYGTDPADLVDIVCDHRIPGGRVDVVARFEFIRSTEPPEWRWTASMAMHRRQDHAGSESGLAHVARERTAVFLDPEGKRKVRLYCRRPKCGLDVTIPWAEATKVFDTIHTTGASPYPLYRLIATITG